MKWFFAIFFTFSLVFLCIFGVNCIYGWIFPVGYQEEIRLASEEFDIDQSIIYSVINIESHFNKDAVSPKGAVGLMQVMPSTAEIYSSNFDLKNPSDNIKIGTKYLSKLILKFENVETALCAYNAGPTNVLKWLKNEEYSKDGKSLYKIPFKETQNYIQKFKKNMKYYNFKIKK